VVGLAGGECVEVAAKGSTRGGDVEDFEEGVGGVVTGDFQGAVAPLNEAGVGEVERKGDEVS
jgi:hypothetical protein